MATLYRAAPADAMLVAPLDAFSAIFHRPSGVTHLLVEPAPQILAALGADAMALADLHAALSRDFDLTADGDGVLEARLGELIEAGLVTPA